MSDEKKANDIEHTRDLLQTMDAQAWSKEFWRLWGHRLNEIDRDLMIAWFANAIMTGWDHQWWKVGPELELARKVIESARKGIGDGCYVHPSLLTALDEYDAKFPKREG